MSADYGVPLSKINTLCREIEELKLTSDMNKNNLKKMRRDLDQQKKENAQVHNAVFLLQEEKKNLRTAVHNLKMRNGMMSKRIKQLKNRLKKQNGDDSDDDFEWIDYDEIGRNFIMIGGRSDPLAFSYELKFSDENGFEHKSAQRYYWYLMADYFGDKDHRDEIRTAEKFADADQAQKSIIGFDEQTWNEVKLEYYTKAQERKFLQLRTSQNLLVLTKESYLASCETDKFFGTGWRKQREESVKPLQWDGENLGGVALMRIREKIKKTHKWSTDNEREEAEKRFEELRKHIWRRIIIKTEKK